MSLETIIVNDENTFDVLIIGSGPAGLTAALYTSRAGFKTGFIERSTPGGKVTTLKNVTNFPGIDHISGSSLSLNFFKQAKTYGAKYLYGNVTRISKKMGYFSVSTQENDLWLAKVIIIATGVEDIKLDCPNAKNFEKIGISYCATCDGYLTKNKKVVVVGNNEEAISTSIFIASLAKQVTLVYLGKIENKDVLNNSKNTITIKENVKINNVYGSSFKLEGITLINEKGSEKINCDFIFVNLGVTPAVSFLSEFKEIINSEGIIETNENKQTKINGIYAVGDVSKTLNRQIITAANDGAIAGISVVEYLNLFKK